MDSSLKDPFPMLVSGGRGIGKTEFTKKLLKSRLIAPPPERTVWCYAKHRQGFVVGTYENEHGICGRYSWTSI